MLSVSWLSVAPVKGLALARRDELTLESYGVLENRRFHLLLLLRRILVGVLVEDLAVRAELVDLRLEQRLVLRFVPGRLRLGQQEADRATASAPGIAAVALVVV